MPRGKPLRNPFEVRVNTRMDERYYPMYDILGRFGTREDALIALAEYNRKPYSVTDRNITFSQLYERFYQDKYEKSGKAYSQSSINCTRAAYRHCEPLYAAPYAKLRADDFRAVLAQRDNKGKPLSHFTQEHIKNLFSQMDKFALQNDIIEKGYSAFAAITVQEEDEPGVPFTAAELETLWANKDKPWVDSVLIYIYSGWRISELILMPASDIDLQAGAFRGGLKTKSGKNRIVPIHSKIWGFVENRMAGNRENALFLSKGSPISVPAYLKLFKKTLTSIGVTSYHTPHDCRHPNIKPETKIFIALPAFASH